MQCFHDGIEKKKEAINEERRDIEKVLFQCGSTILSPKTSFQIMVFTGDINDSLFYSPVTNIKINKIIRALRHSNSSNKNTSNIIIDIFRNNFPLEQKQENINKSVIVKLCNILSSSADQKDGKELLHLFPISKENTFIGNYIEIYNSNLSQVKNYNDKLNTFLHYNKKLGTEVIHAFDVLRTKTRTKTKLPEKAYLIIKKLKGKSNNLIQVGIVLSNTHIGDTELKLINQALALSHFGTLTLMIEKKRYFQKALSQSIKGNIIKYGPYRMISDQIQIINDLHKVNRFPMVPKIIEKDKSLNSKDSDMSWYKMSRFNLMSLMDIYVSADGYKKYEIQAMTRACFKCLNETYWKRSKRKASDCSTMVKYFIWAKDQIERTNKIIIDRFESIKNNCPVHLTHGIGVYDSELISRYKKIISKIDKANFYKVFVKWDGYNDKSKIIAGCNNTKTAYKILNEIQALLKDSLNSNRPKYNIMQLSKKGRLHGDSHFGNFLVDASIPEDALVMTIDPLKISLSKKRNNDDLENILRKEPSYDVAKFMLSAACAYSIIYRSGFKLSYISRNRGILLERRETEIPIRMNKAGGVSGAGVVASCPPVTKDAWNYHRFSADEFINQFIAIQRIYFETERKVEMDKSITLSIISTWVLTIRHAFSIIEKLFPEDVENSLAMYCMVTRFARKGESIIKEAIKKRFNIPLQNIMSVFDLE